MAPWCRDKFLLQYILRIGDATLIVWTNPQNVLLQNLVHVNIPKPGNWIFSTMKLPVFTKDLFETFQIGVKKMAGSAFCTPKMLKHNHHNSSTRRHHLAPVGLLLGLNRSLNLCRIPLKRVTFPDRLAEQRHPHPLWFDESFMGAPKKGPRITSGTSSFTVSVSSFATSWGHVHVKTSRLGRKDVRRRHGMRIPNKNGVANCHQHTSTASWLEKMVWFGGMNRAEMAQVGQFGLSCQWILVRICV
jgi:hypothetical protein